MTEKMKGIILLVICAVILFVASQGTTPEEKDATAVLVLLPIGISQLVRAKEKPLPASTTVKAAMQSKQNHKPIIAASRAICKGVSIHG